MKLYAISIVAMSTLTFEGDDRPGTYVESIPALIPADSIEEAAERAKQYAFERWRSSEGWHTHQANILAVTKTFYDAAFTAHQAGIIDMSDEPGQTFTFDAPPL